MINRAVAPVDTCSKPIRKDASSAGGRLCRAWPLLANSFQEYFQQPLIRSQGYKYTFPIASYHASFSPDSGVPNAPDVQYAQQDLFWPQESVAESSSATQLVKVKFVLEKRCEFGQHFNVVGDDELFGGWNPEASIPMQWSEGHIWTTEMEVFVGQRVEFKVILMGGESVVDWLPGPNRVLEPSEASTSPMVLKTHWGEDDSFQKARMHSIGTEVIEDLIESTAFEQLSSDSVMNLNGLDFPACDDDKSEDTTIDGHPVEMLTEVSRSLASEDANKVVKRKLTVLEKDLQWCREALSMLFRAFRQKGDSNLP